MTDIFKPDDEVDFREKRGGMARAFDLLASLPEDIDVDSLERERDSPQKRKGL
jgi:hypothetical protein